MTLAIVNVLPEPVTPRSVWNTSPSFTPSTSLSMAVGWSPAGGYGRNSSKGEPGKVMNSPFFGGSLCVSIFASDNSGMGFQRGVATGFPKKRRQPNNETQNQLTVHRERPSSHPY